MSKQILLVAHESDVLKSFPVTLTLAGHDVRVARGGLQGIKQARETAPDLVVVDTSLPDMDGPTVQGILRRLPSTNTIPTLLLKPRAHRLMPSRVQLWGAQAGQREALNSADLLRQVAGALDICRRPTHTAPETF